MHPKPTYEELELRVKELEKDTYKSKQKANIIKIQRDLSIALNSIENLYDGLGLCLKAALEASGMDCGGLYLFNETSRALDMICHIGLSSDFIRKSSHYDS